MSLGYLDISTELLAQFCKAMRHSDPIKFFRVVKDGLPHDVVVRKASLLSDHTVRIEIESDEIADGEVLSPWLESVRIELTTE